MSIGIHLTVSSLHLHSWNKRLLTTAGITKLTLKSTGESAAKIELSEKVIDTEERLRSTLLHEMCHAAAWLLSRERKPPHGPKFYMWGNIAEKRTGSSLFVLKFSPQKLKMKYNFWNTKIGIPVQRCHSYDIHKPHRFECTSCGGKYARHSKKGIDIEAKVRTTNNSTQHVEVFNFNFQLFEVVEN